MNEKWYQKTLFIILLLILFFPVGLFLMWKYANWKPKTKWIITGVFIAIFFIGRAGNSDNKQASKATDTPPKQEQVKVEPTKVVETTKQTTEELPYQKISYNNGATVENFYYLYTGTDKTKEVVENIARKIKASECKKPCNISLYDDKKAIDLDLQYNQISDINEAKDWKEKNYVFVANHLLGYLEFEGDGIFIYYPYKDWYYKQLTGI